jgi:hypothetical protein
MKSKEKKKDNKDNIDVLLSHDYIVQKFNGSQKMPFKKTPKCIEDAFQHFKEDKWDLNTVFLLEELFHEVYKMSFYDYFVLSALEHKLKIEIAMKNDKDILFVLAKDKKKSAKKKASKKK